MTWLRKRLSGQPQAQDHSRGESSEPMTDEKPPVRDDPQDVVKPSVSKDLVTQAQANLRQLSMEKEVLDYASTRIDIAEGADRITPEDHRQLQAKYRAAQQRVTTHIQRNTLLLKLHQLEVTRVNLLQVVTQQLHATTQEIERLQANQ